MVRRVGAASETIPFHQKILHLRQKATHVEQKDDFAGRYRPNPRQVRSLREQDPA